MATLYVTEFASLASAGSYAQAAQTPPLAAYTLAIAAGSAASPAFNAKTKIVRLHTDANCSIKFGAAPTAVPGETRMAAGTTEYFGVVKGQKVAVITNA